MLEQLSSFFKESYAELQKVTWISRKEVMGSTVVIMILISILSIFVAFVDFVLAKVIEWVMVI